jgi:hypothetical protein
LLGGATRQAEPVPVLLRSGDVLIQGGACRGHYHGVARVIEGSAPARLGTAAEGGGGDQGGARREARGEEGWRSFNAAGGSSAGHAGVACSTQERTGGVPGEDLCTAGGRQSCSVAGGDAPFRSLPAPETVRPISHASRDRDGDGSVRAPDSEEHGEASRELREVASWLQCHRININVRQVGEAQGWDASLEQAEAVFAAHAQASGGGDKGVSACCGRWDGHIPGGEEQRAATEAEQEEEEEERAAGAGASWGNGKAARGETAVGEAGRPAVAAAAQAGRAVGAAQGGKRVREGRQAGDGS